MPGAIPAIRHTSHFFLRHRLFWREIYDNPTFFGSGPGFVNRTQSDPGFVNPVRSDPVQVLLTPNFGNKNTCKDAVNLVLHVARLKAQHYAGSRALKRKHHQIQGNFMQISS